MTLAVVLCGAAALAAPPGAAAETPEARHRQALSMARAGELGPAIDRLAALVAQFPDRRRFFHDYVTVLGWAERDGEVLRLAYRLDFERAPAYVLETVGKSARNRGRYRLAVNAYRSAVRRHPARRQARIGLALALTDSGAPGAALAALEEIEADPAVLNTRGYALRAQGRLFEALRAYDSALRLEPRNAAARRGRIMTVLRLGAPHLAADLAQRAPQALSAGERAAIERDRRAVDIRWARLAPPSGARPAVIDELEQALAALEAEGRGDSVEARRARFDLIVAYHEHGEHARAIKRYQPLAEAGATATLPAYVIEAVAGAHLARREPRRARALLEPVAARQPENLGLQLTLFYAYIDTEAFEQALTLIDRLAGREPAWLGDPPHRRTNPDRLLLDTTAALGRAFADRLGEAERRLDRLVEPAPHNTDLRSERAYVYLWRGWPRRALAEFEIALHQEPGHVNARTGRAEALQTLADYGPAAQALASLQRDHPRRGQVRALARDREVHRMRALSMRAARGRSSGAAEGTDDLALESRLYTRPLRRHYRAFLHHRLEQAEFPEGKAIYRRLGAGLELRRRSIELELEVDRDTAGDPDTGLGAAARWRPDDHWAFSLALDSYSDDVPLRGRLNEGIDGRALAVDAEWRAHESRSAHAALQSLDFSDHNRRNSLYLAGFQRLVTGPHYKLDGRVELYTSANNRDDAPYFNPEHDFAADLTLGQEWVLHRRYERSFRHRLALTAGRYHQRGFGSGATWAARYEHDWRPDDRTGLVYGITRARRLYDGTAEHQTALYLNLDWRF